MRRIAVSVTSKARRALTAGTLSGSSRLALQVPSSRRFFTSSSCTLRTLLPSSSDTRLQTSSAVKDVGRFDGTRSLSSAPSPAPAAPPPSPDDSRSLPVAAPGSSPAAAPAQSEDPVIYDPVDFELSARIEGEESHVVTVHMKPGECVRAESGSMIFMTDSIQLNTTLGAGASSAFQRMMTGQNLFLTDFTCADKPGELCLGTAFPSKILRLNLQEMEGEALICQKGAYLASNPTVNIEMAFTKNLSTGFFGGQGFVLQKLTGKGDVLVKGGGTIVEHDLREGEKWRVTSGSIVAFESSVDYDIQMMPGIKNAMFGGEGLFVTTLTGPGRVWLQGMPPERMIAEIASRVPAGSGLGFGIPIMGGGGGGDAGGEASDAAAVDGIAGGSAAEQVAATDAAVEADRQATVASSGMTSPDADSGPVDADSPSALFGDAAPKGASAGAAEDSAGTYGSAETASSSSSTTEPSFDETFDDFSTTSTSSEPSFDDTSFSDEFSQSTDASDGELFDDTFSSESSGSSEGASSEGGSSILSTLWDFFMGDDE